MSPAGRRRGPSDTRGDIVGAARAAFREEGFNKASIRAIALRARVDPALVHHYFEDKAGLFVAAMGLPRDPRRVVEEASAMAAGGRFVGAQVVERFLAQWERGGTDGSPAFVSAVQAVAAEPEIADAVREFLAARLSIYRPEDGEDISRRRQALISSQLVGLAWARYVLRIEPLASTPRDQVARWVGPMLDGYATTTEWD
jgi:AcrR family transcriptional regulator